MIELQKAENQHINTIWKIISQSIERRKNEGSDQWQDGYPNPETIQSDVEKGNGYILTDGENVMGYVAVIQNDEPSYETIDGKWLSNGDFIAVHRVAISNDFLGKGYAQEIFIKIEKIAKENGIFSIKVDTNFDNFAMLRILEKLDYTYCGEITLERSGDKRKAFEKLLK